MNTTNMILIIIGIVLFIIGLIGGGILFRVPWIVQNISWVLGIILVAISLWLNEKEKKAKQS